MRDTMADVNARERVRVRLRNFLAEKGLSGRAFGKRLGHGDQWVSNLLNGRFSLSLDDLDTAARIVERTPSELVRRDEDELWELRPTEMRLVRAVRALPPVLRDHLVTLAEYLVGVTPAEIERLARVRQLSAEDQERFWEGADVLWVTRHSAVPKIAARETSPATPRPTVREAPAVRRKSRA